MTCAREAVSAPEHPAAVTRWAAGWCAAVPVLGLVVGCADGGDHAAGDVRSPGVPTAAISGPSGPLPAASSSATLPAASARVDSVAWTTRGGRPSLAVVPSPWQRANRDERSIRAAWERIVQLRPRADQPGMFDQYACHVRFAPAKHAYHLEPWQPAVGYQQTVAQACNPGERKDLG